MRRLASALVLTASVVFAAPAAMANELCAGEFQALLTKHGEVMKQLSSLKSNKNPRPSRKHGPAPSVPVRVLPGCRLF